MKYFKIRSYNQGGDIWKIIEYGSVILLYNTGKDSLKYDLKDFIMITNYIDYKKHKIYLNKIMRKYVQLNSNGLDNIVTREEAKNYLANLKFNNQFEELIK